MLTYKHADTSSGRVLVIDADGVARKSLHVSEVPVGSVILPYIPSVLRKVPKEITMRQAKLLLHSMGLYSAVDEAIAALPEPPRIAAQIEWEASAKMQRDKAFVAMIGSHLGLTDDQIDDMFIEAAKL